MTIFVVGLCVLVVLLVADRVRIAAQVVWLRSAIQEFGLRRAELDERFIAVLDREMAVDAAAARVQGLRQHVRDYYSAVLDDLAERGVIEEREPWEQTD